MNCKYCRQEIDNDSRYCEYCGKYTGRFSRFGNPVFLRRVIICLLLIFAVLITACALFTASDIFNAVTSKDHQKQTDAVQTPAPTSTPLPARSENAKDITSMYTPAKMKKLNQYLSALPSAGISNFSSGDGDIDIDAAFKAAFIYNAVNFESRIRTTDGKQKISEKNMTSTVKKLFGITPDGTSTDHFIYDEDNYYTDTTLAPEKAFAQVNAIYDNKDGTYTVELEIYSYTGEEFSSEYYAPKENWSGDFSVSKIADGAAVMRCLDDTAGDTWVILDYGIQQNG